MTGHLPTTAQSRVPPVRPVRHTRQALGEIQRPPLVQASWLKANQSSVEAASAVVAALVIGRISPLGGNLVYLVCAGYALAGCRQAIQALTVMIVVLMASPAWVPDQIKDLRWLVLACSLLSVVIRTIGAERRLHPGTVRIVRAVLAFVAIEVLVVVLFDVSRVPTVSVFKLLSFAAGAVALVLGFAGSMVSRSYWDKWFIGWFAGVFAASLLVLPLGGGFLRNGQGFEGAFGHPQTLGIITGVAASYFCSRFLLHRDGHAVYLIAAAISLGVIVATQSRTGGVAFILGGVVAIGLLLRGHDIKGSRLGRWWPAMALGCILAVPLVPGQVSRMMEEYVAKGDAETAGLFDAFLKPRWSLMQLSLENHARHPILGIGFGIPSTGSVRFTEVMGIPVSASVEKGFLPTAILEETGWLGAALVIVLLITLFRGQIAMGDLALLWVMSTAILMNLGEAMFFSMGGMGLFVWMMIGWATIPQDPVTPVSRGGRPVRRMRPGTVQPRPALGVMAP